MPSIPARTVAALRALGALVLSASATVVLAGAGPAGAQVVACGSGATPLGPAVEIDRPLPGADVTGTVTVDGRVAPSLFHPSRAELLVGGQVVDSVVLETDAPSPRFSLRWNSAAAAAGPAALSVVACGNGTGALARGQESVTVNVVPPVTSTVARDAGATSPTTVAGRPPAPALAQPPASSTTSIAKRSPTPADASPDISSRLPLLPDAGVGGGFPDVIDQPAPGLSPPLTEPLVLKDARDDEPAARPPWLGLVVGASGVAGLVLSTVVRRRSEREGRGAGGRGRGGRGRGGPGLGSRGRGGPGRGSRSAGRYDRRSERVERDLAALSGRS